jgi:hypothetical protein
MIPAALGGLGTEALGFESALGIAVGSSGMPREAARVLIAYDGSEVSRAAVRHASELFAGRPAVLATVWEEGLAATPIAPDAMRMGTLPQDPRTIETFDRDRERASTVASDGAQLARSVGLVAEAQAVPDEVDVAGHADRHRAGARSGRHRGGLAWDLRAAHSPARKRVAEADPALRPAGARYPRRQRLDTPRAPPTGIAGRISPSALERRG